METHPNSRNISPNIPVIEPIHKNNSHFYVVIASVLIIMTFVILTPQLIKNRLSPASLTLNPTPTPTIITSPTPTLPPFLTYTNVEKGYSVSYPTHIYLANNCIGEELVLQNAKFPPITKPSSCDRDTPYPLEFRTQQIPFKKPKSDQYYKVIKENIMVGGVSAEKYTSTLIYEPNESEMQWRDWFVQIFIQHHHLDYEIYFDDNENLATLNQILTTVKFTQ